jgi:hypothetical protein
LNSSFKRVVETGYDRMAERYLASKDPDDPTTLAALEELPRAEHPALLVCIHRWLKPGGAFLATWALGEREGEERNWEGWGTPMRRRDAPAGRLYDGETSLRLLREAGFDIEYAEVRTTRGAHGDEPWLWVLARKPL